MKAVINEKYGSPDVMKFSEVAKPSPKDNEVLIKVHASSVNAADWHLLRADPVFVRFEYGLLRPKTRILGGDVAGVVESVGAGVSRLKPGDEVFGDTSGYGFGGFAEYMCVPEGAVTEKPANLSFEESAAIPLAGLTALQGLRKHGKVQSGQKVLVNGASGGVGSFAVQIAKALGAEVTAVASTKKLDAVASLGADHLIDYNKEDFTRSGKQYDLILDAASFGPLSDNLRALTPNGKYIMAGGAIRRLLQLALMRKWLTRGSQKTMMNFLARHNLDDLNFLRELAEAGKLKPLIGSSFPLSQVADAIRHMEDRRVTGKIVIAVQPS